ncbi:hypothetical protein FBEOM_9398 [Fusarium beomiforme]|uniref:Uncharacterized protein n=1 Tax=Fusarium beomiforme TaxID=44412 RepID=A0A9P5ADV0_9HYPO|nr:hypothetical protein FBEOM_9398 [Fusarium beomiforme]
MCQKIEETGEKIKTQNDSYMESSNTRSTQGPVHQSPYHVETFPIPTPQSDDDYDYRRTITIQYPQPQWPQDIWVHSPYGRQLYQPVLMLSPAAQNGQTMTNGHASQRN